MLIILWYFSQEYQKLAKPCISLPGISAVNVIAVGLHSLGVQKNNVDILGIYYSIAII